MSWPLLLVLVSAASAAGAVCRYLLDDALHVLAPRVGPWGTWTVNVSGSLLLGLLVSAAAARGLPDEVVTVLGVGFLGSYTTFSTFCVECVRLLRDGRPVLAGGYLAASLLAGSAAAAAGVWLGAALLG